MAIDQQVCCIYLYDNDGVARPGMNACVPILPAGAPEDSNKISVADCTATKTITLTNGNVITVPYGRVEECCVDCEDRELNVKLVVQGGKLVRVGGALTTSPDTEPEKCCCGDKPCCRKVEGCGQVRCYQEPEECDRCAGRCVTFAYDEDGNEIVEDQDVNCETKSACCLADNSNCLGHCRAGEEGELPKTTLQPKAWEPLTCTTCGICCSPGGLALDDDPQGKPYTKETCEAEGGTWKENATDKETACNPPCCADIELGEKKDVACVQTKDRQCDPCLGKCTDLSYDRPPPGQAVNNRCPRAYCKTKQDCCGEGGELCREDVCGEGPKFKWEELGCGTDGDKCGVCCVPKLDGDGNEIGTECNKDATTKQECEALNPAGAWFPFETCAVCDGVDCCKEIECDDLPYAVCSKVEKDKCENKCRGFCNELLDGFALSARYCKTKQDCCGEDGKLCEPDPCENLPAVNEWLPGCADPEKCGVCCIVTLKEDGTGVSDTYCDSDLTKTECDERDDGDLNVTSWRAFETCDSVDCATKRCCGEICPGVIGCKTVDFEDECDECAGTCTNIETGEKFCATKQDCCGKDGAKCNEAGNCHTRSWSHTCSNVNVENRKCGVCCILVTDENGDVTDSYCDPVTYTECQELNNPWRTATWHQYETCESVICRPKPCCKTNSCGKAGCTVIDYNDECPDECAGECTKIVDGTITCATKEDCCGANNAKCEPCPPAVVAEYSWSGNCANEKKCGVCCGVVTDTNGKTVDVKCQDLDRDQCATIEGNVKANEFWTWKPWATCENAICATKKCCDVNCAGELGCVDVDFKKECNECAGICDELNPDGSVKSKSCKTRTECCGVQGYDCEPCIDHVNNVILPAKAAWTGPCSTTADCGVCCKVTTQNGKTVAADCETITKQACLSKAPEPNVTYSWKENVTCASPKCAVKTCCDKDCAGHDECVEMDFNKACDPCKGLCTEVQTGTTTCATKQSCCGDDGKLCLNGSSCPNPVATKIWEAVCADGDKCGVCCKIVIGDDGEITAADCQQITKEECEALDNGDNIIGSWRPLETCGSVDCALKPCCGKNCNGDDACVQIDFNEPCDPCKGVCTDLAEDTTSCQTKQACCGNDGKKCGACNEIPTHSWSNCENSSKCGVCCVVTYDEEFKVIASTCEQSTQKACEQQTLPPLVIASWYAFETCDTIKCATKPCCGEDCAGNVKCVEIDFNDECDKCKGICTDIETGEKFCATKQACCSDDNGKCGGVCGQDQTHSWSSECGDGSKCGVCCTVEYDEDNNIVSATCSNITQTQCTQQNAPPFFVNTWHPFETCDSVKCATKKCCQDSACLGVTCADIDFNDNCNYCHGVCTDTTGAKYCETKQNCCGNDGKNCGPGKNSWSDQCGDGTKCGACCQITYDELGNILNAACIGTDYVECITALENDPPNRDTSWQPFETCASINCGNKPCCSVIDETNAKCDTVPFNTQCDPCKGVCTEIATGNTTCATKEACCGQNGFKCVCATQAVTHTWSACTNDPTCVKTDCVNCNLPPPKVVNDFCDGASCRYQCFDELGDYFGECAAVGEICGPNGEGVCQWTIEGDRDCGGTLPSGNTRGGQWNWGSASGPWPGLPTSVANWPQYKNCHPIAGAQYAYVCRAAECFDGCVEEIIQVCYTDPEQGEICNDEIVQAYEYRGECKLYMCKNNEFVDVTDEAWETGVVGGVVEYPVPCGLQMPAWPPTPTCVAAFTARPAVSENPLP